MKKIAMLAVGLMLSGVSMASTIASTKITSVLVGEAYGNLAFIGISVKPSDKPDCQTNTDYNYIFDISTELGKATLSMVLLAYTAQKDVYLNGFNDCNQQYHVERLRQIWIK